MDTPTPNQSVQSQTSVPTPTPTQTPPPAPISPVTVMPTSPKKGSSWVIVLVIAIILTAAYVAYANYSGMWPFMSEEVFCTLEAKQCPDGSYVGRTGPNCEFAECPAATPDETVSWKTYTNAEYGFEVELPPTWENYTIFAPQEMTSELPAVIEIAYSATAQLPTQSVQIIVYTPAQWALELQADNPHPELILQTASYIFTTPHIFDYSGLPGESDIPQILSTFKLTK